ncbi:MAG TPA: ATP-binding protein [Planctomycetota bacterium]|nr:ATP-binding protein [Planctomycetota bacterium]
MPENMMEVLRNRARLAALQRTALMDTGSDPAFDRLSLLASRILKAPVALVSLVDDERQFFKSCIGLPEPHATRRQTGLEPSFCKHVVHTGEPLIISDARRDETFKNHPGIRDMGIIAYLGIPIQTGDNQVLGSFCVIDSVPRVWTPDDVYILQQLTRSVISEIELRSEMGERRAAEAELLKSQEALQNRILERTAEIARLNADLERRVQQRTEQLERANKALESFSFSVSHDLKAPLRAIAGFADLLITSHRSKLDSEGQHYLDVIADASVRMGQLIDDLLRYARLGQSGLRMQQVEVRQLIDSLIASQQPPIGADAKINFHGEIPAIYADRTLAQQILANILDNAVKYRSKDRPLVIDISMRSGETEDVLCIKDNGIGIPPEYLDRIFDVFRRIHDEKEYPGTGIGLAIVRRAAELMGGRVWAQNPGEGSVICVAFPKASHSPAAEKGEGAKAPVQN